MAKHQLLFLLQYSQTRYMERYNQVSLASLNEKTHCRCLSLQLDFKKINVAWSGMRFHALTSLKASTYRVQLLLSSLVSWVQVALSTHLIKHSRRRHDYVHSLKDKEVRFLLPEKPSCFKLTLIYWCKWVFLEKIVYS